MNGIVLPPKVSSHPPQVGFLEIGRLVGVHRFLSWSGNFFSGETRSLRVPLLSLILERMNVVRARL